MVASTARSAPRFEIGARLVERAKAGGEALDSLLRAVWPETYRIAVTILRDRGLAEDAAQEACAAIARELPRLRDVRTFASWTYRIAVNRALTMARARPEVTALEAVPERAHEGNVADALALHDALAALPRLQRAVLLLHYYGGLPSREIAAATGLRASTVRFHIMRARHALRAALSTEDDRTLVHRKRE